MNEKISLLKLAAGNPTEQRILDYLNENASEVLAEKINDGKKTLAGAVTYATEEARTLAKGGNCVCVDDATVFGWIVHFFEEDEIAEPKGQAKGVVRTPAGVKKPTKRTKPTKPADEGLTTEDTENTEVKTKKPEKPKGPIFLELFSMEQIQGAKK